MPRHSHSAGGEGVEVSRVQCTELRTLSLELKLQIPAEIPPEPRFSHAACENPIRARLASHNHTSIVFDRLIIFCNGAAIFSRELEGPREAGAAT